MKIIVNTIDFKWSKRRSALFEWHLVSWTIQIFSFFFTFSSLMNVLVDANNFTWKNWHTQAGSGDNAISNWFGCLHSFFSNKMKEKLLSIHIWKVKHSINLFNSINRSSIIITQLNGLILMLIRFENHLRHLNVVWTKCASTNKPSLTDKYHER